MFRRESVPSAEKGKYRGEGGNVEVNISGARRDDNLGRAMAYVRIREGDGGVCGIRVRCSGDLAGPSSLCRVAKRLKLPGPLNPTTLCYPNVKIYTT